MSRHDSRAVEAAVCLCAVLLALMLLTSVTGCANVPLSSHSWGDGKWGWADFDGRCSDDCGT